MGLEFGKMSRWTSKRCTSEVRRHGDHHKALDTRRQIGIEISDEKDRGIMHKAGGHKRAMKASMRSGEFQDALT